MSISGAAKIGGGLLVAIGTPATIYATSDHIFLYSVEREVISKDLKLTVTGPSGNDKKITVTVSSTGTDPSLTTGFSWTCEFIAEPENTDLSVDSTLIEKIQKHLPKDETITDKQRNNKELLVRVCSKNREETSSNSIVKGTLKIKKQEGEDPASLIFVNHSELNFLFKDAS